MRSIATIAILLVPLALGACDDGAGPEKRRAESITFPDPDVTIADGDTLQLTPRVLDQNDSVFASIPGSLEMEWLSMSPTIVQVLPDGRAIALRPGTATIRVDAGDVEDGMSAQVVVTVEQVATAFSVVTGGDQEGYPEQALDDSISVRVVDRHGTGVPGMTVRFRIVSGGGTIGPDSVRTTNSGGFARAGWTLGPDFDDQEIEVEVDGLGSPVPVIATIPPLVVGHVDVPSTASAGGTLTGAFRLDGSGFTQAIAGAHVVLTWNPAVLQLQPASLTDGDYARAARRLDNATGTLHLVALDHAATTADMLLTGLVFDVVGAAGSSTTLGVEVESLVGTNFDDASDAGVAIDAVVNIN